MNAITKKPKQLTLAVAALAIVAVAAVMLMAGSGPAQAATGTFSPESGGRVDLRPVQQDEGDGSGSTPTPTPTPVPRTHATPEPCAGEAGNPNTKASHVVDSGHVALFDVYWNPGEKELTNNHCPPTVAHEPSTETRSASSINIEETIIHIPNSAKVNLKTSTTYTERKYQDLWDADDKENPDGDGDGIVWALPACPANGALAADGLCISFSAALLNEADWDGDIVYHVDHVHQIDIDKQDARYVLAYDRVNGRDALRWDSSDLSRNQVQVAPGGYDRPMWFFTSRGTYEFQVHITGSPERDPDELGGLEPISEDANVSSDVVEYILHVGAEADLGVDLEMRNRGNENLCIGEASDDTQPLRPHEVVGVLVTASNAGSEEAPETKVNVTLPTGLTYSSHQPDTYAFADSDGDGVWTWDVGALASGASKNLIINTEVGAGTHGETLTAEATISATETVEITETVDGVSTVETYHVPVLDPNTGNDVDACSTTVTSIRNVDPHWENVLMVEENAEGGTPVGDTLWVFDDDGDTLTFQELTDQELVSISLAPFGTNGSDLFTHSVTRDGDFTGVQIEVASGASLDHETTPVYFLAMGVHDSKDAQGNVDETIDDVLVVVIKLVDLIDEAEDLEFSVAPNTFATSGTATFTLQVDGEIPDGATDYHVGMTWPGQTSATAPTTSDDAAGTYTFEITGPDAAGDVSYEAFVKYTDSQTVVIVESDEVTVSWTASQ